MIVHPSNLGILSSRLRPCRLQADRGNLEERRGRGGQGGGAGGAAAHKAAGFSADGTHAGSRLRAQISIQVSPRSYCSSAEIAPPRLLANGPNTRQSRASRRHGGRVGYTARAVESTVRQPESSRLHGSRVDAKASESKVGCGSQVDGTAVELPVLKSSRRCGSRVDGTKAVESTERSVNWSQGTGIHARVWQQWQGTVLIRYGRIGNGGLGACL